MSDAAAQASAITLLEISGPQREPWTHELAPDRPNTVGRLDRNDVQLTPDPGQVVSRDHCVVTYDPVHARWQISDAQSSNGTRLQDEHGESEVQGAQELTNGDVIRILASREPRAFWELAFFNESAGRTVGLIARLEYDWDRRRVYRVVGTRRTEIKTTRDQAHELLRYMLGRNRDNGDTPQACATQELMHAIWGDQPLRPPQHLHAVIRALRLAVELDPAKPQFVQTVKGYGYLLDPRPTPAWPADN